MRKIFWGLFFIVAGAFVIFDQFYTYTNITLLNLLLTIFIVAVLIKSLYKINFTGIMFSLAFLCIIYSEPLHLENVTPIPVLLAALFGSIGLSILFNRHCFSKKCYLGEHHEHFSEVINDTDDEEVNCSVSAGSSIKYINSEDFKVANLRCHLGSMKVYFDNAKIKGDSAMINVDVSLGGIELYIPKEWKITNKVDIALGAIEPKNNAQAKSEKTVILTGKVSLGAIEIYYI